MLEIPDNYEFKEPLKDMTTIEKCKCAASFIFNSNPEPHTFLYDTMMILNEAASQLETLSTAHERLIKACWEMI